MGGLVELAESPVRSTWPPAVSACSDAHAAGKLPAGTLRTWRNAAPCLDIICSRGVAVPGAYWRS